MRLPLLVLLVRRGYARSGAELNAAVQIETKFGTLSHLYLAGLAPFPSGYNAFAIATWGLSITTTNDSGRHQMTTTCIDGAAVERTYGTLAAISRREWGEALETASRMVRQ